MVGFEKNMLKFTEEELIFINSITKGPAPFGVFLKYPVWRDTEELKSEVLTSLQEKQILGEDKKITEYGMDSPDIMGGISERCASYRAESGMLCSIILKIAEGI